MRHASGYRKRARRGLTAALLGAVGLGLAALAGPATAAVITRPADLPEGALYRLAFVSSTGIFGAWEDVAVYNEHVNTAATNAGLGAFGPWTAIASTTTVHARGNTATVPGTDGPDGIPIYLLDGTTRIADSYADLWDETLDARFDIDELGNRVSAAVWTGSAPDGRGFPVLNVGICPGDQRLGAGCGPFIPPSVRYGSTKATTRDWVSMFSMPNHEMNRLYAFSAVLTAGPLAAAPVPAPAGAGLFGIGLAALVLLRRGHRCGGGRRA